MLDAVVLAELGEVSDLILVGQLKVLNHSERWLMTLAVSVLRSKATKGQPEYLLAVTR